MLSVHIISTTSPVAPSPVIRPTAGASFAQHLIAFGQRLMAQLLGPFQSTFNQLQQVKQRLSAQPLIIPVFQDLTLVLQAQHLSELPAVEHPRFSLEAQALLEQARQSSLADYTEALLHVSQLGFYRLQERVNVLKQLQQQMSHGPAEGHKACKQSLKDTQAQLKQWRQQVKQLQAQRLHLMEVLQSPLLKQHWLLELELLKVLRERKPINSLMKPFAEKGVLNREERKQFQGLLKGLEHLRTYETKLHAFIQRWCALHTSKASTAPSA
jgi:polyhydroxyalkanoate synthesis regulator phasin